MLKVIHFFFHKVDAFNLLSLWILLNIIGCSGFFIVYDYNHYNIVYQIFNIFDDSTFYLKFRAYVPFEFSYHNTTGQTYCYFIRKARSLNPPCVVC